MLKIATMALTLISSTTPTNEQIIESVGIYLVTSRICDNDPNRIEKAQSRLDLHKITSIKADDLDDQLKDVANRNDAPDKQTACMISETFKAD